MVTTPTLMPMMSEMGETSSCAARRGRTEREKAEAPWFKKLKKISLELDQFMTNQLNYLYNSHHHNSVLSTHSNDMCIFELVLCGDEEGGEVLGEEPSEGRRVGEQHLRDGKFSTEYSEFSTEYSEFPLCSKSSFCHLRNPSHCCNLLGNSCTTSSCHQAVHLKRLNKTKTGTKAHCVVIPHCVSSIQSHLSQHIHIGPPLRQVGLQL